MELEHMPFGITGMYRGANERPVGVGLKQKWLSELEKKDLSREHAALEYHRSQPLVSEGIETGNMEGTQLFPALEKNSELVEHPATKSGQILHGEGIGTQQVVALNMGKPVTGRISQAAVSSVYQSNSVTHRTTTAMPAGETGKTARGELRHYAETNIQIVKGQQGLTIWARDYKSTDKQFLKKTVSELKDLLAAAGFQVKKMMLNGKRLVLSPFRND